MLTKIKSYKFTIIAALALIGMETSSGMFQMRNIKSRKAAGKNFYGTYLKSTSMEELKLNKHLFFMCLIFGGIFGASARMALNEIEKEQSEKYDDLTINFDIDTDAITEVFKKHMAASAAMN